jgi:hypothetical protein
MITLEHDTLIFRFPEVHEDATLRVDFQRTLRIADDGRSYYLPPGLGRFPLRHIDDHAERVPAAWRARGGVMLPMYQAEALWISFIGNQYPMLVRVAAGKINAVTGEPWSDRLQQGGRQDYLVVPTQPWLDGYCTEKGVIRQFVAMPLGAGYSPEEQITGRAEFGGIQIMVHPLRREAWARLLDERLSWQSSFRADGDMIVQQATSYALACAPDMALGMGGRMRQQIYGDSYRFEDWDTTVSSRCFVHLTNSLVWRAITGQAPPTVPPTAAEYSKAGLPWFDYYADGESVLDGSPELGDLESIVEKAAKKGDVPLPENESVESKKVITLEAPRRETVVREGSF